jgi:hypothetical protein
MAGSSFFPERRVFFTFASGEVDLWKAKISAEWKTESTLSQGDI